MRRTEKYLLLLLVSIGLVVSCKKDPAPENPYDSIDRSGNTTQPVEPDPNSITGLHKNIFSPLCANPGCHDGTFEPDFRTVESSFATLVYHRVNKVTLDSVKFYSERVIPNNISDSWIIERLTTSTSDYMPSNGTRLTTAQIDHVKNWINAGCPDVNGDLPQRPNLLPNIVGYVAVDSATLGRIDSIRLNNIPFNPFVVQANHSMRILFLATDTADGANATDPAAFNVHEIRFSTDKNNFTGAVVIPSFFYIPQFTAWLVDVPGTLWPPGTTVYFRIYVNDGHHPGNNSEFPRYESIDYYKTIYAFYVQ